MTGFVAMYEMDEPELNQEAPPIRFPTHAEMQAAAIAFEKIGSAVDTQIDNARRAVEALVAPHRAALRQLEDAFTAQVNLARQARIH